MKKFILLAISSLLMILPVAAMAGGLDLVGARQAGLIGEQPDGLIGAVTPNPSAEVKDLIASTNQGRLDVYRETAQKQNLPLETVQKIAAEKLFSLAAPGDYILSGGKWVKK
jgi:uncharacterized protein YdbL (DUF1318 family)